MKRRVRIAYAIKEMVVGGSQTHLRQVLQLLDRERFEPILICLTGKGALMDDVRSLGIPVFTPGEEAGFRGIDLLNRFRTAAQLLRRERIDIVHNYLLRANMVGAVAGRLARVPVVIGSKRGCHERRGFELISAKLGNALADRVMVNAEAVRDFVHDNEGLAKEKMFVVPSGVDTDRFSPLPPIQFKRRLGVPEERLVVGIVTRQAVRKGVEEFLRALAEVRRTYPLAHGVIVGDVRLDEAAQALVNERGLKDYLSLVGRRNDMPEVYSAFDVFVQSSHDEGMSNAILEAMAMEKPVVATDVGGTGEVVRRGETGLLVPPRDVPALSAAIAAMLAEPEKMRQMGRRSRSVVVVGFSARSMVRQMETMYLHLLGQRDADFAVVPESVVRGV